MNKMKPLTRTRRAAIYRKAAENIADHLNFFSCWAISDIAQQYPDEDLFPEFWMFKFQADGLALWWVKDNRDTIRNCRILALLLSAEIALNP